MIKQVVILCGGKGTRLGSLTEFIPKPLVKVLDVPLLERTVNMLVDQGFSNFLMLAGHLGEQIEEYVNTVEYDKSIEFHVHIEESPLGTAGALHLVKDRLEDQFMVIYGDIFLDFDARRLAEFHGSHRDATLASLLVRQSDHPWDSHLIEMDKDGVVSKFIFEQVDGQLYYNWGNTALYACSKELLTFVPEDRSSDFGRDVFPAVLENNARLRALEIEVGGFVRDMGTPDRLGLVENYLKRKYRARCAAKSPKAPKIAFLDRDGTLNEERGLIDSAKKVEMIEGAASAVARLCKEGWECYIITNQPVIARGLCGVKDLEEIHEVIIRAIKREGGEIKKIYYSPYHPETHYGEGVKELRRASDCRKPGSSLLFQAEEENQLDLAEVIMFGDTSNDIIAGQGAGVRTCFLGVREEGKKLNADYVAENLAEAVSIILNEQ